MCSATRSSTVRFPTIIRSAVMPKYHIEMRVVEIHDYEVEADSKDEAIDMIYDLDLKPNL
jgi:hypothetical protein